MRIGDESDGNRAYMDAASTTGRYEFDEKTADILEMVFEAWARDRDAIEIGSYNRLIAHARKWLGK